MALGLVHITDGTDSQMGNVAQDQTASICWLILIFNPSKNTFIVKNESRVKISIFDYNVLLKYSKFRSGNRVSS